MSGLPSKLREWGTYLKLSMPILTDAEYYQAMTEANLASQNITDPPIEDPMVYIDTEDMEVITRYQMINRAAGAMYRQILESCPRSAERTLAIRKLQEARMWANASIAFDGRTYQT